MRFIDGIDEILYEVIEERRADPLVEIRDDALSLLIRATHEDGSSLDDRVIRDELLTMLMAGYETTTAGLTWAFERLLRAPDKLDRLLDELATGDQTYLMAVVKETLRRRPVIPIAARKALDPIELMGYSLPAGSVLMVAIYLIHGDPEIYPDPKAFEPERFLNAIRRAPKAEPGSPSAAASGAASARRWLSTSWRSSSGPSSRRRSSASWRSPPNRSPAGASRSRPAGRDACASNLCRRG